MLEREWVESQKNNNNDFELSLNKIQVLIDSDDDEEYNDGR
jgi:hypothetical protein